MRDDETVQILMAQLSAAEDAGPSEDDFVQAAAYYYCRPRGDEIPGRSVVQSSDVADMVHAVLAQILPSFTQDQVCSFEPDGPNDEINARLESQAVNRVMMESSRGYVVFQEAIKNALLYKNGIVKAYLEEEDDRRYIRLKAVDPMGFRVGADADCILLYNARFLAERKVYSRAELVAMGLDADDVGRCSSNDAIDQTQATRRRQGIAPNQAESGWANERVTVWECYSELPDDEDATTTRLYRCLLGMPQVLLLKEKADTHPYAAGTGFIESHQFWGLSLADRLRSVQDEKTSIHRQWLDNLANGNNNRKHINENVNIEDAKTGRPNGLVRHKGVGPVGENVMIEPFSDIGSPAAQFLGYMDSVRADRGGAALQMASGEMQTAGAQIGSMGVDRIFSVQEQLSSMIARNLAETLLRSAFMQVHRLLRTEYGEPLTLRMADQWVTVDPSQWRERNVVNIRSGLSPGERSRKAAAMMQVISLQSQAMQGGLDGVLVTLPNLYNAWLDMCSALEIDAGEKYFTDPRSQSSMQAGQAKAQQGQQMQAMQLQMAQAQLQIEQQKLQLDKLKADQEIQYKYWQGRLDAETKEMEVIGSATADLQRVELEGRIAAATAQSAGVGGGEARNGSGGV